MPADLTKFAAQYLVYIDALAAVVLLLFVLLPRRPRPDLVRWLVAVCVMVVLSFVFAKIGAALFNDPRPFTQDGVKPLISHAADNGFPSDHALLAAAIAAAVFLASPYWTVPFIILAVLVDWARVGAGIHHVADVVGSSGFVLVALVIAILVAPPITRLLLPYVPETLARDRVAT